MGLFNFWRKKLNNTEIRIIKTIRGKKVIKKALEQNIKIIIKNVEPFQTVSGKYCIVKNKKSGKTHKLYDYRNPKAWDDAYEIITYWTYEYKNHEYPNDAAYVIPNDIKEGEIVFIKDLIENFIGYTHNQGYSSRLNSCKAKWINEDFKILFNPEKEKVRAVG